MHLEAEAEWTQKRQLEAVIDWVWRCTLRLWPSEFGDAVTGYDRAGLEEYLKALNSESGAMAAETLFIGSLVIVGMLRVEYNIHWEMRNWQGVRDSRSWDDAVLGVCCTLWWFMSMAWRDREGWLDFVFLGDGRVEHKQERDQKRWGKLLWETWAQRSVCASELTIPNMAGRSPDLACNNSNTWSSQRNQASCTADFSYPLESSISFSSSSPISLFLILNSTIIAEHKVISSLSVSSWYDHVLTPSTAYTQYSIPQVLHTPSTASTQVYLSSLHSHDYKMTPECSFSFRRTSLHDPPPSASSPWELKCEVTLSHSHGCRLTNWWIESHHPVRRPSTASTYLSIITRSPPLSASPNSVDHGLEVDLQTFSITACKFAWWWPPSASSNPLDYGLQVSTIMASKWHTSNLARSRPPCLSPNWLDYGLQVRMSMASKCISKLARSPFRSASLSSLDHSLQVYVQIPLLTDLMCISKLARSQPRSISLSSLDRHFQAHLELLSSTACSQSRYSVCRWVAIWIHIYIDESTNWIHDCDSRCSQTSRRRSQVCRQCSQVCRQHSQALPGLLPALPVTLKAGRNALLGSDTLLKLTHISLHSTSSQTLLEASSDWNTFCWCYATGSV